MSLASLPCGNCSTSHALSALLDAGGASDPSNQRLHLACPACRADLVVTAPGGSLILADGSAVPLRGLMTLWVRSPGVSAGVRLWHGSRTWFLAAGPKTGS